MLNPRRREGFHRLVVQRLWRCGKCRGRDRDRGKASRVRLRSLGSVVALCLHFAHLLQFGAGRGVQTQSKYLIVRTKAVATEIGRRDLPLVCSSLMQALEFGSSDSSGCRRCSWSTVRTDLGIAEIGLGIEKTRTEAKAVGLPPPLDLPVVIGDQLII